MIYSIKYSNTFVTPMILQHRQLMKCVKTAVIPEKKAV